MTIRKNTPTDKTAQKDMKSSLRGKGSVTHQDDYPNGNLQRQKIQVKEKNAVKGDKA